MPSKGPLKASRRNRVKYSQDMHARGGGGLNLRGRRRDGKGRKGAEEVA